MESRDKCWRECSERRLLSECFAITFRKANSSSGNGGGGGLCFMHKASNTALLGLKESACTSVFRRRTNISAILYANVLLEAPQASGVVQAGLETRRQCWSRCVEESKCVAVSFLAHNGTCRLFYASFDATSRGDYRTTYGALWSTIALEREDVLARIGFILCSQLF